MKLKVNGAEKEFEKESIKLNELLSISGVAKPELVSVQLNGDFVNQQEYSVTAIKNGDEVDFLFFMGGGSVMNSEYK